MADSAAITVLSVSWRSAEFLEALCANLLAKASQPDRVRFLIADNTNGQDAALAALDAPGLQIVPVDVRRERMSVAHAIGLNTLFARVETPYVLVVDPDVIVFQPGWDAILIDAVSDPARPEIVAAGAPYPPWKLGKYHDFPSPPFAFWRVDALRALDPDWRPYARSAARRLVDFGLRQVLLLSRLADRHILRRPPRRFGVGRWAERWIGVVSKDTGWEIADRARRRGWRAEVYAVVYSANDITALDSAERLRYRTLACEFELFTRQGKPFVAHLQSTQRGFSIYLWTGHCLYRYSNHGHEARRDALWRAVMDEMGMNHG